MFCNYSAMLLTSGFQSSLTTTHKNKYTLHLTRMHITCVSVTKYNYYEWHNLHKKEHNICPPLLVYAVYLKNTS